MFAAVAAFALIALFLAALISFRVRGGRVSRLILQAFAIAWSEDRLDRQAKARAQRRYAR